MTDPGGIAGCPVCATVGEFDLIELDALMGDPARWPKTIWGVFEPPKNLPASYRRFGAVEMAMTFLAERGYTFSRGVVRKHYRYDVPKIAADPDELVANGLISSRSHTAALAEPIDPIAYIRYYQKGIEVGNKGLELLLSRIEKYEKANEDIPMSLVKMAVDTATKLAVSQAAIRAAGKPWGEADDADAGFWAGAGGGTTSPRMGHSRVRVIDGEARPVADQGPADRARFSERSKQEGGEGLPHPS